MEWLKVLRTQRGGVGEGTGWMLHPCLSEPAQVVHMSPFPPPSLLHREGN